MRPDDRPDPSGARTAARYRRMPAAPLYLRRACAGLARGVAQPRLDVEAWLQEGLIDVLVVGLGLHALRAAPRRVAGARPALRRPRLPSVNTNTYTDWWKEHFRALRPSSTPCGPARRTSGSRERTALYLFKLFCQEDRRLGTMSADDLYRPLNEIGDPSLLTGLDKLYGIQPTADSGFCQQGSEAAPLPIVLDQVERKLPLHVGPDGGDPHARGPSTS